MGDSGIKSPLLDIEGITKKLEFSLQICKIYFKNGRVFEHLLKVKVFKKTKLDIPKFVL
jgi:hypothetical protein